MEGQLAGTAIAKGNAQSNGREIEIIFRIASPKSPCHRFIQVRLDASLVASPWWPWVDAARQTFDDTFV
jgi:hypothetical protein